MKKYTIEDVMLHYPCEDYPEERVRRLFNGRDSLDAEGFAALPIPSCHRMWALIKVCMSDRTKRLYACWCAKEALKLVDSPDSRSLRAIEVAEQYADGKATAEELKDAKHAAYAAYFAPAGDCAITDAADAADCASDSYTAWADASLDGQIAKAVDMIKEQDAALEQELPQGI